MLIDLECSACHKRYRVDAKFAGKVVKCKNCGEKIQVPVLDENGEPSIQMRAGPMFDLAHDAPDAGTAKPRERKPILPPIIAETVLPLLLILAAAGTAGYTAVLAAMNSTAPGIGIVYIGFVIAGLILVIMPLCINAIQSSARTMEYELPNSIWLQVFSSLLLPTAGMTLGWFRGGTQGLIVGGLLGIAAMWLLMSLYFNVNPLKTGVTALFGGMVYLLGGGIVFAACAILSVILSMSGKLLPWQTEKELAKVDRPAPVAIAPTTAPTPAPPPQNTVVTPVAPTPVTPTPLPQPVQPQTTWASAVDTPAPVRWPADVQLSLQIKPPVTVARSNPPGPIVALLDSDSVEAHDLRNKKRVGFMKQSIKARTAMLSPNGQYLGVVPATMARNGAIEIWSVADGKLALRVNGDGTLTMPQLIGFAAGNRPVVMAYRGSQAVLQTWDVKAAIVVREVNLPSLPMHWALSPGGKFFAMPLRGKLHVYVLASGKLSGETDLASPAMAVLAVAFSPDGVELAAMVTDAVTAPRIVVLDMATGKQVSETVMQGGSRPDITPDKFRWAPGAFAFVVGNDWIDRGSGRVMHAIQPMTTPNATAANNPITMLTDYSVLFELTPTGTSDRVIFRSQPLPRPQIEAALKLVHNSLPTARVTAASTQPDMLAVDDPGSEATTAPAAKATAALATQKEWIVMILSMERPDPGMIQQEITEAHNQLKQLDQELTKAKNTAAGLARMGTEDQRGKANIAVRRLEDQVRDQKGVIARLERTKDERLNSRTLSGKMDDGVEVQITAEGTAPVSVADLMQIDQKYKIAGVGRAVDGVLNIKLRAASPAQ